MSSSWRYDWGAEEAETKAYERIVEAQTEDETDEDDEEDEEYAFPIRPGGSSSASAPANAATKTSELITPDLPAASSTLIQADSEDEDEPEEIASEDGGEVTEYTVVVDDPPADVVEMKEVEVALTAASEEQPQMESFEVEGDQFTVVERIDGTQVVIDTTADQEQPHFIVTAPLPLLEENGGVPFGEILFEGETEDGGSLYDPDKRTSCATSTIDSVSEHASGIAHSRGLDSRPASSAAFEEEDISREAVLLEADEIYENEEIPVSYHNAFILNQVRQDTVSL
jgi:hypothetical protein